MSLLHVHRVRTRSFPVPAPSVACWLPRAWTGGADDIFPVDVVGTRRDNPAGAEPAALIPDVTLLGHSIFPFRFRGFDGRSFRVDTPFGGWHGFDLEADVVGCRLTHTLDLDLPWPLSWAWILVVRSGHDWAVDAMFDRLAVAVDQGAVPERTSTRPPVHAWLVLWFIQRALPVRWRDAVRLWLAARIPAAAPNVRSTPVS